MMNMVDAIGLLGDFTVFTVTRETPASIGSDGRSVSGALMSFSVTGLAHPLEGEELQRLPEGLRSREVRAFFCDQVLLTAVLGAPDVVSIDGAQWEVQDCQSWAALGAFSRSLVARKP